MSGGARERLSEQLSRWRNLEECLLHEFRWSPDLYSADIVFNNVRDDNGRVRERVLEEPVRIGFRLVGIDEVRFVGALTEGMKRFPERINWGLAEVATVGVLSRGDLLGLSVRWESDRLLEVICVSIDLLDL